MKKCNCLTLQHKKCKNNSETCPHHSKSKKKPMVNFRLREHNIGDLAFMCAILEIYFYFSRGHIVNGQALINQLSNDLGKSPELILSSFPWFRQYLQTGRGQIEEDVETMLDQFLLSHPNITISYEIEDANVKTFSINNDIMAITMLKRYLNRRG